MTNNSVPSVRMATSSAAASGPFNATSSAKRRSGVLLSPNASRTHLQSTINYDPLTPLPGRYSMHLADNLLLRNVKSIPDLSDQLSKLVDDALGRANAEPGKPHPRDICIPDEHTELSKDCRQRSAQACRDVPVATIEDVGTAFKTRHTLAAAISSVLVERSSTFPGPRGGILRYSTTPTTLHGNDVADLPHASAYLSVHAPVPDLDRCQSGSSSVNICGSDRCKRFPELNVASNSGRPTGVDGDRILQIIEESLANTVDLSGEAPPVFPPPLIASVVFLWQDLWSKAVAVDASCMVLCSGHEEVIFLRERRTQTMFMSKTLSIGSPTTVEVPSHLKIHCGVALLAWKDVHDRQAKC
ncbi:hypothetical protein CPB85DRAFT_1257982 [Mucidula mucida]|nr:hypothetical protein CPB85DRAFT_1257982 [Mucidula mucida]